MKSLVIYMLLLLAPNVGAGEVEKTSLFRARTGGYELYRIPGIVVTQKGTVLTYCEARKSASGDWGAIDVLMRRSTDGGRTWSLARKIVSPPKKAQKNPAAIAQNLGKPGEVTVNNPVAIVDRKIGVIHFLYCIEYARCYYMRSDDDGLTFSKSVDITPTFDAFRSEYDWKVLATGPGHGIQLDNGRLLVPVWLSTGTGGHAHRPSCVSTIFSDDQGKTWQRGEIVVGHPTLTNPSETVAVQLVDGRVMLNIRHESTPHFRAVAFSNDGVSGWSKLKFDRALPEPICMGSIVRLTKTPEDERNCILFANPHNPDGRQRKNLTIKLSYDEGRTWPVAKVLEPGISGYSDLAVGPQGTIFCFYEDSAVGNHYQTKQLTLARFTLEWILGSEHAND